MAQQPSFPNEMPVIIHSTGQLEALRSRSARRDVGSVVLELPGDSAVLKRAERDINRGLRACGCELGAVFLLTGAMGLAASAWLGWRVDIEGARDWVTVVLGLGLLTLAGKATGLILAERRLRSAIAAAVREANSPEVSWSSHESSGTLLAAGESIRRDSD